MIGDFFLFVVALVELVVEMRKSWQKFNFPEWIFVKESGFEC